MPIFTASSAYLAASLGVNSAVGLAAVNFGVRVVAAYALTKLINNRDSDLGSAGGSNAPGTQLPPATDNKLPVVYGTQYVVPCLIDAKMSEDQTSMWFVLAISEATDTGEMSFGRTFWGDKELIFGDAGDATKVTSWIDSNDVENTNINGNMWVYFYKNGSNEPANSGTNAISLLQDVQIPELERWTINNTMTNCAFAVVKMNYSQDASLTGVEQLTVETTNSLTKPGSVIKDYLMNSRYGCGISVDNVDETAFEALDTYSDVLIDYVPVGGGTASQPRYRVNGMVNTNNPCLTNLQQLVDSCDSWLQWDEVNNKWSVIINRSYTDTTTYENLFVVNDYNIIGGIDVTPVDLNNTYNSVEVQFHNTKIKDKTDYSYSVLPMEDRNPNEPENQLVVQQTFINNSVQAEYLAVRRLIQSREDLFISFTTDYSGIQVEAGDVIRVSHPVYGWGPTEENPDNLDKLFRVSQVIEETTQDGSLCTRLNLFEYNEDVYANVDIEDYTPAQNTGIPNPGWISSPGSPTVTNSTVVDGEMSSLIITATVPATGSVLYMDFYYGTNSDPATHTLYRTVTPNTGRKFANGEVVKIQVNDLPRGTYYWSVRARGSTTQGSGGSASSAPSAPSTWDSLKVLAPALIGSQLLGGLAKSVMRPDVGAGYRKGIVFNPQSSGPPINVTSTTERNRPLYFTGAAPDSDDIFPWYQGTYGPAWSPDTSVNLINEGDSGWYKLIYWDTSVDKISTDEMGAVTAQFGVLTDTANTEVQIASYQLYEGNSEYSIQYPIYYGYTIPVVEPYPYQLILNDVGTGQDTILEWGYFIRNITPGSQLTVFAGYGTLWQLPKNGSV